MIEEELEICFICEKSFIYDDGCRLMTNPYTEKEIILCSKCSEIDKLDKHLMYIESQPEHHWIKSLRQTTVEGESV